MSISSKDYSSPKPVLARDFEGRVVGPGDADYDTLRTVHAGGIDKRPALILRPKNAQDVSRAIAAARDAGVPLSVRSGGHSGAGHSTNDGGFVIDLRDMKTLEIDVAGRSAWAETGLTAGEVSSAVTAKGLVVGFGDAATVGIGGITLGGGVGYLSRKHGLTIDSVLAVEIVTAAGEVRIIDDKREPELFWAVRGGGGNFGVVTRFQFRLHPLPAFTGGMMALPATAETIAGFLAAADAAPEELSTIANVMPAPPLPFLPAQWHGKPIILGMLAFAGEDAAAQEALKPFRALATPLADFVKPGPYMQMYPPEEPGFRPTVAIRTFFVDGIDAAAGGKVVDYLAKGDAAMRVAQFRVLGGAAARVPSNATAYGHRNRRIMVNVAAFFNGVADRPKKQQWVDEFARAISNGDRPGAYVNFLNDEGPDRIREAYPGATWDRLRQVKAKYDPENLFRLNQNIPPSA